MRPDPIRLAAVAAFALGSFAALPALAESLATSASSAEASGLAQIARSARELARLQSNEGAAIAGAARSRPSRRRHFIGTSLVERRPARASAAPCMS